MGTAEVTQFLTYLAIAEHVAAATQNQALNAIVFLYRVILQQELVGIDAVRAKRSRYLPTVLTPDEVQRIIPHLYGVYQLVVQLLYGSGLRLSEGLQLRVKDIDFAQHQLVIRDTKGKESRVTMLPARVLEPLQVHLQIVRLPVAIDTPLGRLDSSHRTNLVERYFPYASHQVILLSTDTEIAKTEVEQLRQHNAIAREYLLKYNSSNRQTTIEPGYFW